MGADSTVFILNGCSVLILCPLLGFFCRYILFKKCLAELEATKYRNVYRKETKQKEHARGSMKAGITRIADLDRVRVASLGSMTKKAQTEEVEALNTSQVATKKEEKNNEEIQPKMPPNVPKHQRAGSHTDSKSSSDSFELEV